MNRAVISDLGRVIIFFDNRIFYNKMTNYCPFSAKDIAEKVFDHFDLIRSFDKGEMTPMEFYSQVIKILDARIDYKAFFPIYNDVFSLNPPVLEILKRLKSKYRLVMLSNTDIMRFSFVKKKFPEILIFDEYVLSFEVGHMKPHPLIYIKALEKAGVKANESIFIDDIKENIEAAQNLGIGGILFGPQTDLEAELRGKGLSF